MQERIPDPLRRLAAYWRWWRLLLMAVTVTLLGLAVEVDNTPVTFAAVAIGFLPLMVLMGLSGRRTDMQHQSIHRLEKTSESHDAQLQHVPEAIAELEQFVKTEAEAAGVASARARSLPAPGDVTIILVATTDDDRTAKLLGGLAKNLQGSVQCLVVDRTDGLVVGAAAAELMPDWPGLALITPASGLDVVADLNEVRDLAGGRYLLVLDESVSENDIDAATELCRWVPEGPDSKVGARVAAGRADLALVQAVALADVGGWQDSVMFGPQLRSAVVGLGLVVEEEAKGPPEVAPRRVYRTDRRDVSVGQRQHELSGAIALFPQAAYHTDELIPLASEIASAGEACSFVVPDRWWPNVSHLLHRTPQHVFALPDAGAWLAGLRAVVTMNDWARDERDWVDAANHYGVPTFGKVAGAHDFQDVDTGRERRPYQRVRHVLCQGTNDADAIRNNGGEAHVVGSTRLEQLWALSPREPAARLVVINLNFTWNVLEDARDEFLRTAIEGCESAGLEYVVSAHPDERSRPDVKFAAEPMSTLLGHASVLVSRFSTVPFEAMARGVPFVYHNPHGEQVPTFSDADGAFETSAGASELADALDESMGWVSTYRHRCEPFFRAQVDIDPERTSAQRTHAAIEAVLSQT